MNNSMAQFLFQCREKKRVVFLYNNKGRKKNVERFSQDYYFWRRDWGGGEQIIKIWYYSVVFDLQKRTLNRDSSCLSFSRDPIKIKNPSTWPSRSDQ